MPRGASFTDSLGQFLRAGMTVYRDPISDNASRASFVVCTRGKFFGAKTTASNWLLISSRNFDGFLL